MLNMLFWVKNVMQPEETDACLGALGLFGHCAGRIAGIFLFLIMAVVVFMPPAPVEAATLTWDRNTEADMKDYEVYTCLGIGCTVLQTSAPIATVVQPAVGVVPSVTVDLSGKQGAVAVTARDTSGNESGLSVSVPFDFAPPMAPKNLGVK